MRLTLILSLTIILCLVLIDDANGKRKAFKRKGGIKRPKTNTGIKTNTNNNGFKKIGNKVVNQNKVFGGKTTNNGGSSTKTTKPKTDPFGGIGGGSNNPFQKAGKKVINQNKVVGGKTDTGNTGNTGGPGNNKVNPFKNAGSKVINANKAVKPTKATGTDEKKDGGEDGEGEKKTGGFLDKFSKMTGFINKNTATKEPGSTGGGNNVNVVVNPGGQCMCPCGTNTAAATTTTEDSIIPGPKENPFDLTKMFG